MTQGYQIKICNFFSYLISLFLFFSELKFGLKSANCVYMHCVQLFYQEKKN